MNKWYKNKNCIVCEENSKEDEYLKIDETGFFDVYLCTGCAYERRKDV